MTRHRKALNKERKMPNTARTSKIQKEQGHNSLLEHNRAKKGTFPPMGLHPAQYEKEVS